MASLPVEAHVKANVEDSARQAPALIRYLDEGDFVTRRYVSRGSESASSKAGLYLWRSQGLATALGVIKL